MTGVQTCALPIWRDEEAVETAKLLIGLDQSREARDFFVDCVKGWTYFPGAENLRDVFVRALREAWARPSVLFGIAFGILERSPVIGPAMRRAAAAWPRRVPLDELLGAGGLAALSDDDLLFALLETEKTFGLDPERFLTSLRAGLLQLATDKRSRDDQTPVRLACALARQCYINEYIYDVQPDETERAAALRARIARALANKGLVSPLELAVAAAYAPLDGLPADAILKRTWPTRFAGLIEQQIRGPMAERRQRASIPRITPIADETSLKVQSQYEENPYPRWTSLPSAPRSMPIDDWFRTFFPMANYKPSGKAPGLDILIAGCGTGQHSIMFAQSYPGAKVLAIDLSLASLGYAKLKTREMELANIEYAQADILELGSLNRNFDVISSGGVLHHLADMMAGWRVLLSLLRPGGCMHIALYSELARRSVVSGREFIARRGFAASDIPRARQELIAAAAENTALKGVLEFPDFYATSDCRDLLFHVQETRCTIPQIAAFLSENNLEFLGFVLADSVRAQFEAKYSRQKDPDLNCWQEYETQNPDTFRGMYEFWVQKRA